MSKEKWEGVISSLHPGEYRYLISSWGRVYDMKSERYLKSHMHKSKGGLYWRVSLAGKKHMNHKLVAIHFKRMQKELRGTDPIIKHLDGNTLNPNENNLAWDTQSNNMKDWHQFRKAPQLQGVNL